MCHYNVKIINLSNAELHLIKSKPVIKEKLRKLLRHLKKFRFQLLLVLEHMKENCQIFCSNIKLITGNSGIDELFKSMHQGILILKNNMASEDWVVIIKRSIKIFEC